VAEHRRLDARVVSLQKTVGLVVSAVTAVVSMSAPISAWTAARGSVIALAGFGLLWVTANLMFALFLQRWPAVAYRHTSYSIDERGIEIRRGVFWRTVVNVPRSRVQHTDVSQGPLERRYGLGTLVIYTAGTEHARVTLAGLDHAQAMAIRENLMPERGTDAV
jgi:membrane protein YdbS with pleckstrin-like domain